ncbi:hypothetical protein ACIQWR_09070 [Streptomyces sp. NPDC098789]|uniref:hypothetical protein n=1 Tax=Streptomyces sp. NPDC098789 TaxID=3366098 RepID=UPI0038152491
MAEALRAAAQGLPGPAVAMAAGVPERMLRAWAEQDPAFAAAWGAARALAAAHGAGGEATPAALRVVLDVVGRGASWPAAARLAGSSVRRFNRLRRTAPGVESLLVAAQQRRARTVRQARAGRAGPPDPAAGADPAGGGRYRLVALDDPLLSHPGTQHLG